MASDALSKSQNEKNQVFNLSHWETLIWKFGRLFGNSAWGPFVSL